MDSPEGQLTTAYDPQTKQLSALTTEDGQQTSFTHDGPLQTAQTYDGEIDGSVALTYDNLLRLSGLTTPAGSTTFTYDRDSLLTSAGGMSLTRHPQTGLITSTSVSSVATTTAYNQFAEPTTQTYAFPGGAFSETYERDQLGRIAAKNVTTGGSQSRYVYTYDQSGRLTDITKDGNPWRTYAYDANSNRTSVTRAGEPAEEATFDAQDKMLSQGEHQLTYNANGELIQKQRPSSNLELSYTSSGQMKAAETSDHELTFSYDALGNRTLKKVGGATTQAFLYAPGILGPVAQLSQGSSAETRFVYASRANVPDLMVRGGQTYRLITDQLGSVRLVVNAGTGAVAQEIEYDPFGEVISDSSPGFQPFGFAGGLYDSETGLTHFGAREYDAELGRWTSRDPIGFAGGDSNLYGYVVQDPVNLKDPYGLYGVGDLWGDVSGTISEIDDSIKSGDSFEYLSNYSAGALNTLTVGLSNRIAGVSGKCAGPGYGFGSGGRDDWRSREGVRPHRSSSGRPAKCRVRSQGCEIPGSTTDRRVRGNDGLRICI